MGFRCITPSYNTHTKESRGYWTATYKESNGESFGCLGGFIYGSIGEAINAILNDVEEMSVGLGGYVEKVFDYEHNRFTLLENGNEVCVWEPQFMKMSSEANELD